MKDIFKKYLHSEVTAKEFELFSDFVTKESNTDAIHEMMKPELERSLLDASVPVAGQNEVYRKVVQQILEDQVRSSARRIRFYAIGMRIAALLVCGLIFSSLWFYLQSGKVTVYEQLQTVTIPYGAKTRIAMPDGSTVWLNSGTTLSYSSDFSKKREVMLKGEAFFDIQKSRIPFEVITGSERIRVLGTAFNVLAYSESGFVTTLVRGSVEINSEIGHQRLTLQPGQQVSLVGDSLVKSKVETELFTSWKDGKMIFKREPFPNLMKRLERWFNVKIEYEPDQFKDLWYSGTIENETITEVMEMVGTAAPVRFTFDSRTRIIKVMPRKK
jgi:transmembrane sensor